MERKQKPSYRQSRHNNLKKGAALATKHYFCAPNAHVVKLVDMPS